MYRASEWAIGDRVLLEAEPITGAAIVPLWFALRVPMRKDFAAVEFLRKKGMRALAPEKEVKRRRNGKVWDVKLPSLPGIIYARFEHRPHWHVMRARRLITGVISANGQPIVITEAQIAAVKGLGRALEALEEEKHTIAPGDRVSITKGLFEGHHMVEVTEVRGGMAWMDSLGMGRIGVKLGDVKKEEG